MGRNRRTYSAEFKRQAVALATSAGASVTGTARSLGVPQKTLDGWVHGARVVAGAGEEDDAATLRLRVRELERQLARAELEKEILKKATAFFASQSP
jgi:transposase